MRRGVGNVKMVVIITHAPGEVGTIAGRGATARPAPASLAGDRIGP
jgi:hypothetical protein